MTNIEKYQYLMKKKASIQSRLDSLSGERAVLINTLKEAGFTSLKEAKVYVEEKEKEIAQRDIERSKKIEELSAKLDEIENMLNSKVAV